MAHVPRPDEQARAEIHVALNREATRLLHSVSPERTVPQHRGYSRCLPPFPVDNESTFLGTGYELPKDEIANWDKIVGAHTCAKNNLIREIFA
jgi:hypothetical protein